MNHRVAWQLMGLVAVFLLGPGNSRAAVQGRDAVYWLGTGDWQLCEKKGDVYLVESHWDKSDRLPKDKRHGWHVSAPTIKGQSGKCLGSDPEGRNPSVHLVSDKSANTRWAFEFVSTLQPGRSKEERHLKQGPSGCTFRAKMAEGPFKDWYLAAGELTAEQNEPKGTEPASKRLKLVRDVKEATIFTYIEENYYVDHK